MAGFWWRMLSHSFKHKLFCPHRFGRQSAPAIISIEICKQNSKPFVITSWYRPPNSPHELFVHVNTLLGKLDSENVDHFLMGDLNCGMQSKDNVNVKALLSITDIYGLDQLINEPTPITPNTSTLIDLIFTNRPENVYCSGVCHVVISDHSLVYAYKKISIPTFSKGVTLITYRQFKVIIIIFYNILIAQNFTRIFSNNLGMR